MQDFVGVARLGVDEEAIVTSILGYSDRSEVLRRPVWHKLQSRQFEGGGGAIAHLFPRLARVATELIAIEIVVLLCVAGEILACLDLVPLHNGHGDDSLLEGWRHKRVGGGSAAAPAHAQVVEIDDVEELEPDGKTLSKVGDVNRLQLPPELMKSPSLAPECRWSTITLGVIGLRGIRSSVTLRKILERKVYFETPVHPFIEFDVGRGGFGNRMRAKMAAAAEGAAEGAKKKLGKKVPEKVRQQLTELNLVQKIQGKQAIVRTHASNRPSATSPCFMEVLEMRLELPVDEYFRPAINIRVMDREMGGLHTPMLGYGAINLRQTVRSADLQRFEPPKVPVQGTEHEENEADHGFARAAKARWAKLRGALRFQAHLRLWQRELSNEEQSKPATGLKWEDVGSERPSKGKMLEHEILAEALAGKRLHSTKLGGTMSSTLDFSQEEWDAFSITELDTDHYIKSGDHYFRPADVNEQAEAEKKMLQAKETLAKVRAESLDPKQKKKQTHSGDSQEKLRKAQADLDQAIADLDSLSDWRRGRQLIEGELEKELNDLPFEKVNIYTGQGKGFAKAGTLKVLVRLQANVQNDATAGLHSDPPLDDPVLQAFRTPQEFVVRVYALEMGNLSNYKWSDKPPDPYISVQLGDEKPQDTRKDITRHSNVTQADIFRAFEFPPTKLPGDSTLTLKVLDYNLFGLDDVIGSTEIDLEDRVYSKTWNAKYHEKPPIETRQLYAPGGTTTQAYVKLFVEILSVEESMRRPVLDISPPPPQKFELRVICWEVKNFLYDLDDSGLADLYVSAVFSDGGEDSKRLRTDTHFRAQDRKAAWNWRFKFPVTMAHNSKHRRLHLQLWDMDISFNDFAGPQSAMTHTISACQRCACTGSPTHVTSCQGLPSSISTSGLIRYA